MFTGIIQHLGTIREAVPAGDGRAFAIDAGTLAGTLSPKDSLAVDGTCLTVESVDGALVRVTAILQTLKMTTLGELSEGSKVNLETAATLNTFLGGHLVQGHVDGVATVRSVVERETGREVVLDLPPELMRYVIDKGSVALDGTSLTVAEKSGNSIRVALIPETLERTVCSGWKPGTRVNVETDAIGKYVENFLRAKAEGERG